MVFFDDHEHAEEPLDTERAVDTSQTDSDSSSSPSVTSPPCSQLFMEVRGHSHVHPVRIDLAVTHSIPSLATRPADLPGRVSSSTSIPTRSATSLRSLFDLARPSSTYGHGRELGGRSSVLALQVPASSLPPPLTASAIVDSFQINASTAFFSPLACGDEGSPSTRESLPCMPCQPSQSPQTASAATSHIGGQVNTGVRTPPSHGDVVRRLTEVLQGRGDEGLLLNGENMMSQWLQALDIHVLGACRADERLQPMLRWNTSCSGADGHLLAHLSQHFKVKELGMLVRCLCAPLVSIRVGKIQRQGRLLCPTASRGYLSLTMLPCSEMRLSFVGDGNVIERIAAIKSADEEENHVILDMINEDPSGRSFVLRLPASKHFFWQSERSRIVGDELIGKMKEFLLQRPTLSELTGIHQSRLNSFVSQLRNDRPLTAGSRQPREVPTSLPDISAPSTNVTGTIPSVSCGLRQSPRLSPRASGFKEGVSRGLTNARSLIFGREKHRRRLDRVTSVNIASSSTGQCSDSSADLVGARHPSTSTSGGDGELSTSSASMSEFHGRLQNVGAFPRQVLSVPLVAATLPPPCLIPTIHGSTGLHLPLPPRVPISTSTVITPYYCPCPLQSSALQYTITPPFLPPVSEPNLAPSSPPFFSVKPSSALIAQTTISLDRVSISPIPLPVSSLVNVPTPLQTCSLSSFFSDPIVHVPVVDFQSANTSFLVGAPPTATSSGIPTLFPSFLSNILSSAERSIDGQELAGLGILQRHQSEDEHREHGVQPWLIDSRLLTRHVDNGSAGGATERGKDSCWSPSPESMRSSSDLSRIPDYGSPLLGVIPAILTSGNLSCVLNLQQECGTVASMRVSGSRGLYGGSSEPGIPAPSIATCSSSLGRRCRSADFFQTCPDIVSESSKDAEHDSCEEGKKDDFDGLGDQ